MKKRKCSCSEGFVYYADSFDRDNGKPCWRCNPAGLSRKSWQDNVGLGRIRIPGTPAGAKSKKIRVVYTCGCRTVIHDNGHLMKPKRPSECPTVCHDHDKPVKTVTTTITME